MDDRRQRLKADVEGFIRKASRYMFIEDDLVGLADDSSQFNGVDGWESDADCPEEDFFASDDRAAGWEEYIPETLPLPSTVGMQLCRTHGIQKLAEQELQLRYGQANDALHRIRLALGHKSHLYRNNVRSANSQRKKLRAFDEVAVAESEVRINAKIYLLARQAMISLDAPAEILTTRYMELKKTDLKVTTALVDPQAHGLGSVEGNMQPWIWTAERSSGQGDTGWLAECKHLHIDRSENYPNMVIIFSLSC